MQPDVLTAHDRDFRAYTWNYEAKTIGELIEVDGERGGDDWAGVRARHRTLKSHASHSPHKLQQFTAVYLNTHQQPPPLPHSPTPHPERTRMAPPCDISLFCRSSAEWNMRSVRSREADSTSHATASPPLDRVAIVWDDR